MEKEALWRQVICAKYREEEVLKLLGVLDMFGEALQAEGVDPLFLEEKYSKETLLVYRSRLPLWAPLESGNLLTFERICT